MNKVVYVMNCGDFVKIGVSSNVKRRSQEIPYEVKRTFSTEPLENAFSLEKEMHDFFAENRCDDTDGREYFSVPFEKAVEVLKNKDPRLHRKEKDLHKEKIMLNVISKLYYMNDFDLGYLAGLADFTTIPEEDEEATFFEHGIRALTELSHDDLKLVLVYATAFRDKAEADKARLQKT